MPTLEWEMGFVAFSSPPRACTRSASERGAQPQGGLCGALGAAGGIAGSGAAGVARLLLPAQRGGGAPAPCWPSSSGSLRTCPGKPCGLSASLLFWPHAGYRGHPGRPLHEGASPPPQLPPPPSPPLSFPVGSLTPKQQWLGFGHVRTPNPG